MKQLIMQNRATFAFTGIMAMMLAITYPHAAMIGAGVIGVCWLGKVILTN